jgi:hypothetical protein
MNAINFMNFMVKFKVIVYFLLGFFYFILHFVLFGCPLDISFIGHDF